jgi:dUTP pyrophosphatase
MIKYYLTPKALKAGCKFEAPRHGDAGYDIYAAKDATIYVGTSTWIPTGLYLQIPSSGLYPRVGLIRDRSSMAGKHVFTHAGVIDSSYRGEVKINMSYFPDPDKWIDRDDTSVLGFPIKAGDKIAQLIIVQHIAWHTQRVLSVEDLSETERGEQGFGSTGI